MKKNKSFRSSNKMELIYYSMMSPFLLIFTVFLLIPIFSSIVLSFTDFNLIQIPKLVGIQNYVRIFTEDEVFITSLKNTFTLALVIGPIGYILSFVTAWLINELGRGTRTLVTFMVYSPSLAGNIYFIWKYIFSADRRGFLNTILIQFGIVRDPISWLSDTSYNMVCVMIVSLWLSFGVGFLSFIAALQSLDRSYYEAAAIDGLKNRWQELYYVTFPQIGPTLLFGAVMSISSAFATGSVNAALTGNPSTEYSTHTVLLHMIDFATVRYEMGYASAVAVILFMLMVIAWRICSKLLSRFTD